VEGRLHWSEVQVVYGSLRHILRGIETAGREYAFVSGGDFAGVVDLEAGNLFFLVMRGLQKKISTARHSRRKKSWR